MEVLPEVFLGISILADVILCGISTRDSLSPPPASLVIGMHAWRIIYSVQLIIYALWYLYFIADAKQWCVCHYNTYRMYINATLASSLMLCIFTWLADTREAALCINLVMMLPRLILFFRACTVWFNSMREYHADASVFWKQFIDGL
jgi:hypothetical protein